MKTTSLMLFALMCGIVCTGAESETASSGSEKVIHLRQDDAQIRYESRIYQLKNAPAEELLPFVNTAVQRYSRNSTVRRIPATDKNTGDALLVTTGRDFLPYVDDIVAALDRADRTDGSAVSGTGVARIAYTPRYRAASEFSDIIDTTIGTSEGKAYVNLETNTIFWRDQTDAAKNTLKWVEKLDRPLPQVRVRLNYYELRDSDLKDWGFDYLAWKNGPGVNLLNLGYNAGQILVDELLEGVQYAASATWGFGGFFTAPQFDMSFIRCLQQSGNANVAASASLTMVNTPVRTPEEYAHLRSLQQSQPDKAPFLYRISMYPEYQNISKNTLGRTLVGKSYYEDEDGVKHADPPALDATIACPFICLPISAGTTDPDGFIPYTPEMKNGNLQGGGILFNYALYFKNAVERGNTGAELNNSVVCTGSTTLAFGGEKILTVYDKENDVEQTIGLPILCRIPYIKYLFSTVTTIKERTYIVVTAEAELLHPGSRKFPSPVSETVNIKRRIENPFRDSQE